jgi:hypothetical protein
MSDVLPEDGLMALLNRSALVVKPRQPFLEWLHAADPTSRRLTLSDLAREPIIYLIPECETPADVEDVLYELCEKIFTEQLAGWYTDTETWPQDRSFDVFCRWFDYREYSMVMDLCDEPLFREPGEDDVSNP